MYTIMSSSINQTDTGNGTEETKMSRLFQSNTTMQLQVRGTSNELLFSFSC